GDAGGIRPAGPRRGEGDRGYRDLGEGGSSARPLKTTLPDGAQAVPPVYLSPSTMSIRYSSHDPVPGIEMRAVRRAFAVITMAALAACGGGSATAPAGTRMPAPATTDTERAVEGRPIGRDLALATFDSAWERIAHTHYDTSFRGLD